MEPRFSPSGRILVRDAAWAHWKRVEQAAEEGVSFLEGMRLLAGMPAELDQPPAGCVNG